MRPGIVRVLSFFTMILLLTVLFGCAVGRTEGEKKDIVASSLNEAVAAYSSVVTAHDWGMLLETYYLPESQEMIKRVYPEWREGVWVPLEIYHQAESETSPPSYMGPTGFARPMIANAVTDYVLRVERMTITPVQKGAQSSSAVGFDYEAEVVATVRIATTLESSSRTIVQTMDWYGTIEGHDNITWRRRTFIQ